MTQFILAVGNPVDGLTFYGPFDDQNDAPAYAERMGSDGNPWWVCPLTAPDFHQGAPDSNPTLIEAARAIIRARDHYAEHGAHDPTDFHPEADQAFDDWAADILETALTADKPASLADSEAGDPDLIECDALVVRDGPVSITRDTGAEREEIVARFATIRDAESFLGRWAGIDPDDLKAGRYGINAPHGAGCDQEAIDMAKRFGATIAFDEDAPGWRYKIATESEGWFQSKPFKSPAAAALECLQYRDPD